MSNVLAYARMCHNDVVLVNDTTFSVKGVFISDMGGNKYQVTLPNGYTDTFYGNSILVYLNKL